MHHLIEEFEYEDKIQTVKNQEEKHLFLNRAPELPSFSVLPIGVSSSWEA